MNVAETIFIYDNMYCMDSALEKFVGLEFNQSVVDFLC